jgi:hypothetical protein
MSGANKTSSNEYLAGAKSSSNQSQEQLLKYQSSYNIGDKTPNRMMQVNNLRKTLISNI